MKNVNLLMAVCLLCMPAFAQYNLDNLKMDYKESTVQRCTVEKLRLYPIRANDIFRAHFKDLGDYANLKEAIDEDKIKVSEVSESGTVNTLYIENFSEDSIYVMSGEVVKGGKQDRVIAQDFILAPGQKVDVAAFCVERGRWAKSADGTQFKGYGNTVSTNVRKAVTESKNQSEVWKEVAVTTQKNKAESSTGTYNALEKSDKYQKELKTYLNHFKSAFNGQSDVVGVVAVSADKVIACDLFATNDMFNDAYQQLLHSYATEAITSGGDVKLAHDEVQQYLNTFLADEERQEEDVDGKGAFFDHGSKRLHINTY